MLFLEDALRHAECPICLLSLQGGGTASQGSDTAATAPTSAHHALTSRSSISTGSSGDLFSISFAPGVREALHALQQVSHDDRHHVEDGIESVVVLKCGHIYHYACALQLFEHEREKSKCPLCRHPVRKEEDLIPFRPQRRVETSTAEAAIGGGSLARGKRRRSPSVSSVISASSSKSTSSSSSSNAPTSNPPAPSRHELAVEEVATKRRRRSRRATKNEAETETEREDDGVLLVETRQQPPNTIYVQQLQRASDLFKTRAATLHEREHDLLLSKKQLEDDCADLETAVAEARRRGELLCPAVADRQSVEAQATRLAQLRQSCAEMQRSSNRVAAEMSAAIHENASLKKEIDRYASKLELYES